MPKDDPLARFYNQIAVGNTGEAKLYYSSVTERDGSLYTTSSRSIAVLGIGDDLAQAQAIAEEGAKNIFGQLNHRSDIGTEELINKRIEHMRKLRG